MTIDWQYTDHKLHTSATTLAQGEATQWEQENPNLIHLGVSLGTWPVTSLLSWQTLYHGQSGTNWFNRTISKHRRGKPPFYLTSVLCSRAAADMCESNVSHLPTKITAKDREKQYPGILHESGGKLFCIVVQHKSKSSINKHFATAKDRMRMAETYHSNKHKCIETFWIWIQCLHRLKFCILLLKVCCVSSEGLCTLRYVYVFKTLMDTKKEYFCIV